MRRASATVCALLAVGCAHAQLNPSADFPRALDAAIARTRHDLAERVEKNGWPGLAVGVVIDGQLVYSQGFGVSDPDTRVPVTEHTLFRLASLTKLFTGLALLQLRDAGKLDLDDPLSKYVPEIAGVVYPTSEHPPIRLRHLVTHTSGLPRDGDGPPGMTGAELVQGLRGLPLEFTPGTEQSYSNLAMALAGLVISSASGLPYRDYMRQFVLGPLGMTEAVWDPSAAAVPVARGMIFDEKAKAYRPIEKPFVEGAMDPAGGLHAGIAELARFAAFEMSAWPARSEAESDLLSRSSLRESQLPAGPNFPPSPAVPGVTWFASAAKDLGQLDGHSGLLPGYESEILLLPRRHIAVLVLSGELQGEKDVESLAQQLLATFGPLREEPPPALAGPLSMALSRLLTWIESGTLADASMAFDQEMITGNARLLPDTERAREKYGRACRLDRVLAAGTSHARVRVKCARGDWEFSLRVGRSPAHPVVGWWW